MVLERRMGELDTVASRRDVDVPESRVGHGDGLPFDVPLARVARGWTLGKTSSFLIVEWGEHRRAIAHLTAISPERLSFRPLPDCMAFIDKTSKLMLRSVAGAISIPIDVASPIEPGTLVARIAPCDRALARELLNIVDVLVASGRAFVPARPPVVDEAIVGTSRQLTIVESLARNGCRATLRVDGFAMREGIGVDVNEHGIVLDDDAVPFGTSFTLELAGYDALYSIDIDAVHRTDAGWLCRPTRMSRLRHRTFRRAAPPPGTHLEFSHPRWPELRVRREVREVSTQGLSFRAVLHDDLLYPGLLVPEADLYIRGRHVRLSGEVRALTRVGLAQISGVWKKSGSSRQRVILMARAGGPVAAAVLESADDGLHLFQLLDAAPPSANGRSSGAGKRWVECAELAAARPSSAQQRRSS